MNRIVKMNLFDIPHDCVNASDILTKACKRKIPMRVKGCHISTDKIFFVLEELDAPENFEYVLTRFVKENEDEIIAEINTRYFAGFSFICGFRIADSTWALYELVKSKDNVKSATAGKDA